MFHVLLALLMLLTPGHSEGDYGLAYEHLTQTIPACEFEDGSRSDGGTDAVCLWHATSQGNGEGESLIVVAGRIYLYDVN